MAMKALAPYWLLYNVLAEFYIVFFHLQMKMNAEATRAEMAPPVQIWSMDSHAAHAPWVIMGGSAKDVSGIMDHTDIITLYLIVM